jgi:hypothetical protein
MKMVLVYDTDNVEDFQNSIGIMRKLVNDYDARYRGGHREFGRIEFIKALRHWEKVAAESPKRPETGFATLKSAKQFTDELWRQKKNDE